MRLLLITNLFPPQELGGYGRSMADFAWGLEQRGHELRVLSSNAPYLEQARNSSPVAASISRSLLLKGSFEHGVHQFDDPSVRQKIDQHNLQEIRSALSQGRWDGVLLGNLDLLGPELLSPLLQSGLRLLHHIGYTHAPFGAGQHPHQPSYRILAASEAVRRSLIEQGLPVGSSQVVYPGARCDLFGPEVTGRSLAPPLGNGGLPGQLGSLQNPLRLCFAGLMMSSKSPHTLAEALLQLKQAGIEATVSFAGGHFQPGYVDAIQAFLRDHQLNQQVNWFGQLSREQLARYLALHHVLVFPSVHPEAFGIVAAEAMASGLVVVTSGVGGAGELVEDGLSGLRFDPGNAQSLAAVLMALNKASAEEWRAMAHRGRARVQQHFSVERAAAQIEAEFAAGPFSTNAWNNDRNRGQTTF